MIKVGIVGGTGYTGVELLRLLATHSQVDLTVITSRAEQGLHVADLFPNLRGHVDLKFSMPDTGRLSGCDLVFFATPNGVAMQSSPALLSAGTRVIDLAADFRLNDAGVWEQWYGQPHLCPELLAEAIYGLPEVNRETIKKANLVANPGCYPTAVQLGLLPLINSGKINAGHIIADCKSGVSGAGRKANVGALLCESSDSLKAYAVNGHRHLPEIRQGLSAVAGKDVGVTFVPHLTPMIRGIHATIYVQLTDNKLNFQQLYEEFYENEPFVDILPSGICPETRSVKGANTCRIGLCRPQDQDTLVIMSVIDNLVKGAAGQAVQNMNIMFGFDETQGLDGIALMP
jgi:N-acetyl-gamma-glutamyl-phosphate reductase